MLSRRKFVKMVNVVMDDINERNAIINELEESEAADFLNTQINREKINDYFIDTLEHVMNDKEHLISTFLFANNSPFEDANELYTYFANMEKSTIAETEDCDCDCDENNETDEDEKPDHNDIDEMCKLLSLISGVSLKVAKENDDETIKHRHRHNHR